MTYRPTRTQETSGGSASSVFILGAESVESSVILQLQETILVRKRLKRHLIDTQNPTRLCVMPWYVNNIPPLRHSGAVHLRESTGEHYHAR